MSLYVYHWYSDGCCWYYIAIYTKKETINKSSDSSDDDHLYQFCKMHCQQRNENDAKKRQSRGGVPRLARLLTTWIVFVHQSTTGHWRMTTLETIRATLLHISGCASGCVVPYLKRFLKIWLKLIRTFNRRRMPWVWSVFRHIKRQPQRFEYWLMELWRISRMTSQEWLNAPHSIT